MSPPSVPVVQHRAAFASGAPSTIETENSLPPPRMTTRKSSLGVRGVSGASAADAHASAGQPHVLSEAENKAERQRARQAAMQELMTQVHASSNTSTPGTTPPSLTRTISAKSTTTTTTHFNTSAHATVAGEVDDDTSASEDESLPRAASSSTASQSQQQSAPAPIPIAAASAARPVPTKLGGEGGLQAGSQQYHSLLQDILNQDESDDDDDGDSAIGASSLSGVGSSVPRPIQASSLPRDGGALAASASFQSKMPGSLPAGINLDSSDSDSDEDQADMRNRNASALVGSLGKAGASTGGTVGGDSKQTGGAGGASSQGGGQLISEFDLSLIANPLTRAEVLEQNLSTLGNYSVLNPLHQAATAKSNLPHGSKGFAGVPPASSASSCANLVRLSSLSRVQSELERMRSTVGLPTACCLHTYSKFLCIGTSRGVVLLFDRFEALMFGLGKADDTAARTRGSITCVDLNGPGDMLLVGYSRGSICCWDITHKSMIKSIPDASTLPITSVKFTRQDSAAKSWTFMAADTQGCLNLYVLSKQLFSYGLDKQVLLQGKAGPVLASSMLFPCATFGHMADHFALLAIATEAVISIVALEPQVQIVFRMAREPNERVGVQPCLAWRPLQARDQCLNEPAFLNSPDGALVSTNEAEVARHPTLLVCRGRSLTLLQALPMDKSEMTAQGVKTPLKFRTLLQQSVSKEIKSCSWLANGQLIVLILAPTDDLLILNPFSSPLQCLSMLSGASIGIVHQEFFSHPVSGAPELTFAPSIHATEDCILLLGSDKVSELRVLPWTERLDAFIHHSEDNPQWIDSLALSIDLYNGTAHAPFGLQRDRASVHRVLQSKMVELITSFVSVMMTAKEDCGNGGGGGGAGRSSRGSYGNEADMWAGGGGGGRSSASSGSDKKYLKVLGGTCIAYCIAIQRLDLLFGPQIYDKFRLHFPHSFAGSGAPVVGSSASALLSSLATGSSPVSLGSELFLELLEGYVLTDQLVTIPVPILQELFPLYHFKRRLPQLEQMLLHLNPLSLDLAYLIPTIKAYRLFSACIYMYNRGQSAFHSPLDEILGVLTDPSNLTTGSLAAAAIPSADAPLGPISDAEKFAMAYKLLLYIDYCFLGRAFPRKGELPAEYKAGVKAQVLSVLFRKDVELVGGIALPNYPYLSYFLNLHTQEFLHILSIVFDDDDDQWMQYIEAEKEAAAAATSAAATGVASPMATPTAPLTIEVQKTETPRSGHSRTPSSASHGLFSFLHSNTNAAASTPSPSASATASPLPTMGLPSTPTGAVAAANLASPMMTSAASMVSPGAKRAPAATLYLQATGVPSRQQMLDALLFLILDQLQYSPPATSTSHAAMMLPFTYQPQPDHLHELFKFAATYLARGSVTASKQFIQRIFLHLCAADGINTGTGPARASENSAGLGGVSPPSSASSAVSDFVRQHAERQQMLLSLLGRVSEFDVDSLLKLASVAGFHGVCAVLYIKKRDFARALDAFLRGIDSKENTVLPLTLLHSARPDAPETAVLRSVCNKPLVVAIFDFIHQSISDTTLSSSQVTAIRTATLQALPQLVAAHSERTARLILEDFSSDHDRVVSALNAFPELQFLYLQSIMMGHQRRSQGPDSSSLVDSSAAPVDIHAAGVTSGRLTGSSGSSELSMTELLQRSGFRFSPRVHELYIKLMCIYSRNDVLTYLSSSQEYNIDAALKLCQEYHVDDASAFLLERTGDVQGALELTLQAVDQKLVQLRNLIEKEWRNYPEPHTAADVQNPSALHASATLRRQSSADETVLQGGGGAAPTNSVKEGSSLVASPAYLLLDKQLLNTISTATLLCQRSNDSEKLWFALLDRFVTLQRTIKQQQHVQAQQKDKNAAAQTAPSTPSVDGSSKASSLITAPMSAPVFLYLQSALFSYVRLVLGSMMQHLDLHQLITKITTDHQSDSLREFRETIQGLLDTYAYEQSILATANNLLSSDKFHSIEVLQRKKAHAFQPRSDACGICTRTISDGQFVSKFIIFDCGHMFHEFCLGKQADSCMLCQRDTAGKKRVSSRSNATADKQAITGAPSPLASPTRRDAITAADKPAVRQDEFVHRLMLAERRFDKGSIRSVQAFNTRLKRFGRGGLDDDNFDDDEFLSSATAASASRNPFAPSAAAPINSPLLEEDLDFNFEMPSTRSAMIGGQRQPGTISRPQVVKQMSSFDFE